jgi:protein-S-isoprenylcysteine O-methyltransferase Ste14
VKPARSRPVVIALGLVANLGILLTPALLLGGTQRIERLEIAFFVLGTSALYLADAAGQDDRLSSSDRSGGNAPVEGLAWAQALSVLATLQAGLLQHVWTTAALPIRDWRAPLGLVLMLAGASLRYAAIRTLGMRFVTEIQSGPELVRRGVYGLVRHPSETGLVLALAGTAVLFSSTAALIVLGIAVLPIVVIRTCKEDAVLAATFGAEHERYARVAGRFLPRFRTRRSRGLVLS